LLAQDYAQEYIKTGLEVSDPTNKSRQLLKSVIIGAMFHPTIILTGFMGTGKSTIGRGLAESLGRQFVDSDDLISRRTGSSIAELFEAEGEAIFRAHERRIAREFAGKENLVIATGGGLMVDPLNAVLLGRNNIVICLNATPEEILSRLKNDGMSRPLLQGPEPQERLKQLLSQRVEAYAHFCQVESTGKQPEQIIAEIEVLVRRTNKSKEISPPVGHIKVRYPGGDYPVLVGQGLLSHLDQYLDEPGRTVIITDSNVGPLHAHRLDYLDPLKIITVPAGEEFKSLATVRGLYSELLACGVDRQTTVISLGGGVVGDMAGFAAATFMRGLPFVQCPTTLLAMVDASVGAKTGVDLPEGKNLVGAFKQPRAVVADLDTLATLDPVDFQAGLSETVKHGLIASPSILAQLEGGRVTQSDMTGPLPSRSMGQVDLLALIVEAILIKRDVVEADPFETGRRKILNLGHTFAHAIEQASGYRVKHGQAVAIGLVSAINLSARLELCRPQLQRRIEQLLTGLSLPTTIPAGLLPTKLLMAMGSDKKKAGGRLHFVLIREVGDIFVSEDVPEAAVLQTLETLSSET